MINEFLYIVAYIYNLVSTNRDLNFLVVVVLSKI